MLLSCSDDIENFDENQAIIGKFQAKQSFSEDDPNAQPVPSYKWNDLEDGFIFELKKDGKFNLTKYDGCSTGTYSYDDFSNLLTLNFDCAIEINGESFVTISEDINVSSDRGFSFWHEFNRPEAKTDIASTMLRIE
jgi:hypothetical protein